MFLELTDHLRCPADHPEGYLVLIPDRMEGRQVLSGTLGCPVCHAEYPIVGGVVEMGTADLPRERASAMVPNAAALHAFLGLEGPGGYVGLVGDVARQADELARRLPGVHLVAVNPEPPLRASERVSVVRAPRMPLKARSLRGVVVGLPEAAGAEWRSQSVLAVLPGLRAAGAGPAPGAAESFELLGTAEGWWVGRRT